VTQFVNAAKAHRASTQRCFASERLAVVGIGLKARRLPGLERQCLTASVWPSACHYLYVSVVFKTLERPGIEPLGKREKRSMQKQNGFSLIELLIVIAIILIIAAIAIPNFMRARMAANDSSAAASVRMINTAEIAYFGAYPTLGYPATLATLGGASPCAPSTATACVIDNYLATNGGGNGKSGYSFNATGSPSAGSTVNDQFYSTGTPLGSYTGTRSYCSIQDAVLRLQPAGNITLVPDYPTCLGLNPMGN
jgi:prepilin-type N-terminal cleavage/methylation domain-containing protein